MQELENVRAVQARGKVLGGNITNKEIQWTDFLIHSVLLFHLALRYTAVHRLCIDPASQIVHASTCKASQGI